MYPMLLNIVKENFSKHFGVSYVITYLWILMELLNMSMQWEKKMVKISKLERKPVWLQNKCLKGRNGKHNGATWKSEMLKVSYIISVLLTDTKALSKSSLLNFSKKLLKPKQVHKKPRERRQRDEQRMVEKQYTK